MGNEREIELKVPFILQIQLLENLPLEILHLIVRKFMRVGDVLNLRETSRSMRDKITKELAETIWIEAENIKILLHHRLLESRGALPGNGDWRNNKRTDENQDQEMAEDAGRCTNP